MAVLAGESSIVPEINDCISSQSSEKTPPRSPPLKPCQESSEMNVVEIKKSLSGTELKTRSSILSKHSSMSRLESPQGENKPILFLRKENSTLKIEQIESTCSPAAREPRYKEDSENGRNTRHEGRHPNISSIEMEGNQSPTRTVKSSMRKNDKSRLTGMERREAFTMTETATSVEVLHPRFANASANSVIEVINYYGNSANVRSTILLSAAEKKKIKMSHSNVYKNLGMQFSGITPQNIQ